MRNVIEIEHAKISLKKRKRNIDCDIIKLLMLNFQSRESTSFFLQLIVAATKHVSVEFIFAKFFLRKTYENFRFIPYREKVQIFAKKIAKYERTFLHFSAKVFVRWKP